MARRGRRAPITNPQEQLNQRVNSMEGQAPPWAGAQSPMGGFRIIAGVVSAAGGVVYGSGFSSGHFGGYNIVSYDTPFPTGSVPIVVASQWGGGQWDIVNALNSTPGYMLTDIRTTAGTNVFRDFSFIVIGPVA